MSSRNTIIVLILLIIIGGYALYQNHQPPPETNPKVYHLDAKDIQKIDLRSPDRDIVLERGNGADWKIVKPLVAKAEAITIDSIATQIADLAVTDTADKNPSNLAPFGLAVPAVVVTVTTKDGKTLPAIQVGKQTPIGSSVFIKTADKPAILLVVSSFAAAVNKHVDDLRSNALFTFKPEDAHKIAIQHGGQTVELTRSGDKWSFTKPKPYAADGAAVATFLQALSGSQITQFLDDDPSDLTKYGLASPSLTIALAKAADQPGETVRFGFKLPDAHSNAVYARSGNDPHDPVYSVANTVLTGADKGFDDLRDKTVIIFDPATVARMTFTGGPIDEMIERVADGKWNVTSDGKTAPAETLVAQSLLDQLHDLKATRVVEDPMGDPSHYGMVKPTLSVALFGKDGKAIGTIHASILQVTVTAHSSDEKPQNKTFGYVTSTTDPAVFEVPAQTIGDLENTGNRLHSDATATPTPSPTASAAQPSPSPK
jgi:hypothetical protein